MSLKAIVDSIEGLSTEIQALYAKDDDGKFRLSVEDADNLVDNSGLKSALEKERKSRADFEKKLKALEGIDPEKYQQLIADSEKRDQDLAIKRGEWDKLKAQLIETHKKEIATLEAAKDEEISKYKAAIEKHVLDAAASRAIAEAKGNHKLLFHHVRNRLTLGEDFSVQVLNAKGEPWIDGESKSVAPSTVVDEFKGDTDFKAAFPEATGGGASGGGGPSGGVDFSKLSPVERINAARKAGIK